MSRAVLDTLRRLQEKETATRPPVIVPAPAPAATDTAGGSPRDRARARLRAALQAVSRAYPAGLHESLTPAERAALSAAELRLDEAWRAGEFLAAELAVEAWGRLWLETIKRRAQT